MFTTVVNFDPNQRELKLKGRSETDSAKVLGPNITMPAAHFGRTHRRCYNGRSGPELAIFFLLLAPATSRGAELKPETIQAWKAHVCAAKVRMEERTNGRVPFLWVDEDRDLTQRLRVGEILLKPVDGESPRPVPGGLIHDWIGAVFVAKAKLDDVVGVLSDYDHYKDFYRPMVAKARLLEQAPDQQRVTLLMVQKAFSVTGAVETDNEIQIARLGADRAYSMSTSVRVQEIADYGKSSQHALPQDHGPGYVWRTFYVTRLEQRDGGVYIEMEMIGMSRGIPVLLRWLIQPLAECLPRNALLATLQDTRDAVILRIEPASSKSQSVAQAAHR